MKLKGRVLKKVVSLLAVFVLSSLSLAPVLAQGTDGTIAGTITDPQGGVVVGAKVIAKNKATAQTFNATTSDNGAFRISNVPVGEYTVTIEAPNFKTASAAVKVELNRVTDVNTSLQPGAVSETVTVTAGATAELVETTTSQLGKSFEDRKVIELPIGQDVNSLALLTPNVTTQGAGVLGVGGSVGGNRARNNSFTLDGIDNNDVSVTGPQIAPIQDAVKEFTILTNQFTAESGHSSAGQFNTITKTGTNQLHGDVWWYNQNKAYNALDHRFKENEADNGRNGDQVKRPRFDFNRIGGDLGGRIIKDKLFYFGAYQYQTTGTAGSSATFGAPTAAGFAKLAGISGVSPFVLNILKSHVPPAGSANASVSVLGNDIPVGDIVVLVPSFTKLHQWHSNIDWLPTDRDQVRGRVFWDQFRSPLAGTPGPEFQGNTAIDNRLFSFTEIHNFSNTILNEFKLGYRRQVFAFDVPTQFSDFPGGDFPNFDIDELGLFIGPDGNSPQSAITNVYQGADNVSWSLASHQLKFGVDYRDAIAPSVFLPRGRGEYAYASLEDFLRDIKPTGGNGGLRGVGSGAFAGNQHAWYFYAQDDWKLKPNFTLNLGVRYEYTSNARDVQLQNANKIADVDANDPILQQIRTSTGLTGIWPDGIHFRTPKTDKNNWAPRIGFAWAPNYEHGLLHHIFGDQNQSSVRAGFGISYDVLFQNLPLLSLPPQFQSEIDATSGSGGIFGTDTKFLQNGGIPSGGPLDPALFTDRDLARGLTQGFILDQQTPYTIAYSLAIQREFAKNWSVEVRYLGTRGVHLFVQSRFNGGFPPKFSLPTFFSASEIPSASTLAGLKSRQDFLNARKRVLQDLGFFGNFTGFPTQGNSIYHSASINVKRRLTAGFTVDASYTFSRTIDDSTNELFSSFVNPRRPQDNFDMSAQRAQSVLSHPHRFVASWIYELPYKGSNGFTRQLLGNWQISGVYQAESGQLVDALSFNDANGNLDNAGDRAVFNPNGTENKGSNVNWVTRSGSIVAPGSVSASQVVGYVVAPAPGGVTVNPNARFVFAGTGAKSTAGRNLLRAPGLNNFDMALFKRFPITERVKVEFRAETFNTFNHPQFIVDDSFATDYVDVTSARFQDKTVFSGRPRVMQLVLRVHF